MSSTPKTADQMGPVIDQIKQFQRDIADAERQVALWRAFTAPVPVLFDALKNEVGKASGMASNLQATLKEYDAGKNQARDVGEDLKAFQEVWKRCQELHAAMHREKAIAEQSNPMLGGKW